MSATTNNLSALVAALKSSDQRCIDACLKDPTSIKNDYIAEQGCYLIHIAITYNQIKLVKILLANEISAKEALDDKYQCTPLLHAVAYNRVDIVKFLIESNVNIHATNPLEENVLYYSARLKDSAIMEYFLGNKDKPNIDAQNNKGFTALHAAALCGNQKILECLLNSGASINIKDKDGMTALHYAARKGFVNITTSLLENNAVKINQEDFCQRTPLHYANEPLLVSILLQKGAEIDHQDSVQATPLHYAVDERAIEKIFLLLENGANFNLENVNGDTAFDLLHGEDVVKIFKKAYENSFIPKRSDILIKLLKFMLEEELKDQLSEALSLIKAPEKDLAQAIQKNIGVDYLPDIAKLNDYDITTFFLNCTEKINDSKKDLVVNKKGKNIWEVVAEKNHLESLRAFLNHVAFKNMEPTFQFYFMKSFMDAGNIEALRILLDTGINLNQLCEEKGLPLLYRTIIFVKKNKYEILKLILEKAVGLNVNVYFQHKCTALHAAFSDLSAPDSFKIFSLLLEHGADIRLADADGKTVLFLIVKHERLDFIKHLLDKGKATTEEIIRISNRMKGLSTGFKTILQRIHHDKLAQIEQEKKNNPSNPLFKIRQCAQENLKSIDYTYSDCIMQKGFYTVKIEFKEKNIQLFSLYCLLKENGYDKIYIDLAAKNICIQFRWDDRALVSLPRFFALFDTKFCDEAYGRIENNYKKIIEIFFPQKKEHSLIWEFDDFFLRTKAQRFTENTEIYIKYKFENAEDLKKCTSLLSIARLQFISTAKHIIVYYPLSLFLNSESCQQHCDNWQLAIEKIEVQKETVNSATEPKLAENKEKLESTSSQLPPKIPPISVIGTYETSFAPPEILAANEACQKANFYRRKNKKPKPLVEMLSLEGPMPVNKGMRKKGTSSHQPAIRKPSEKTNSVKPDSPPLQQNSLSANTAVSCSTKQFGFFSAEAKKEITDVHAKPDLILYPLAPEDAIDFVTNAPKSKKVKKLRSTFLAPAHSLPVKSPAERFEAYLTGYLDEYKHRIVNPMHLTRAIYYRIIHALVTNLHNEILPNYNELNRLRNILVHDFCLQPGWDSEENRQGFLLKLAGIFANKSLPDNAVINEIYSSIPRGATQDNTTLIACMNKELKHLKQSFKVFKSLESKNQFFDGSQQYLVDSCLSSVSIISECVHILNKKDVSFPDFALFLDECRISIRNPAMHRSESTSSAGPQGVNSIFNEKEKEVCYQLLFGLSELSDFSEQSLKGCQPIASFARKR